MQIKKILIANRGEIAIRIMRSAKEMDMKTVAVYSDADRKALHVRYADEAVYIGPSASKSSYLDIERIIQACKTTGADAVHPGYGFLSENPAFAKELKNNDITFIGPTSEAIEIMGNKLTAKATVKSYNIPLIPGTAEAISDITTAIKEAKNIGFPVLIKAAAGGGGKGMRVVNKEEDLNEELNLAISEAQNYFGDGSVFLERYIDSPRHIEIQILGDQHGNVVHLFERECSIQRRHQKVIEEAPSSIVNEELRIKMGKCAVNVARACNYVGAGTVEFILDENSDFYFLEMNTRLQVEHPITELITGVDLVKEQINIALGKVLTVKQNNLSINGHAIELRVYAEDPKNNFLPDIGTLQTYSLPEGPGVRIDNSYVKGMEIPVYYDPMISKLIVWGKNRNEAISRMIRAIDEYKITGIESTLAFGKFVMQHPAFKSGKIDTHFVSKHFKEEMLNFEDIDEIKVASVLAKHLFTQQKDIEASNHSSSNWKNNRLSKNK